MLLLLLSRFSRVRLCATPQTAAHQAPPSLGFSRQEHWSGLPSPPPVQAIAMFNNGDYSLLWGDDSVVGAISPHFIQRQITKDLNALSFGKIRLLSHQSQVPTAEASQGAVSMPGYSGLSLVQHSAKFAEGASACPCDLKRWELCARYISTPVKEERGHHTAASGGWAEWRGRKVGRYKLRHARFGKLILLPVLHRGLFVSRLLSVHYNSHIQEGGELAKPVI